MYPSFSRALPLMLFAVLSVACNGCGGTPGLPDDPPPPKKEVVLVDETITIATYNTGLGPGMVPYYAEREPLVVAGLGDLPHDLLCVQEAWTPEAERQIKAALERNGDNVYMFDTEGLGTTGEDRCEMSSIQPVLDCIARECGGVADEDVSSCGLSECQDPLAWLYLSDPHCLTCIAATTGLSADEVRAQCTSEKGVSRVQKGHNGIILSSLYELADREALVLEASAANRVALLATVMIDGNPLAEVACTHLSASQPVKPMHTSHSTWEKERIAQLVAIDAALKERAAKSGVPMLLLGDLNTSAPISDDPSPTWEVVEDAGWVAPASEVDPPICTSCPENTLKADDMIPAMIDHVLTRRNDRDSGRATLIDAERILDTAQTVIDRNGDPLTTDLSDHYGLLVTMRIKTR